MKHALGILTLFALVACTNDVRHTEQLGAGAPIGMRPHPVFWSPQTGAVEIEGIGGDATIPWEEPVPKRLYFLLVDNEKASLFRRLVKRRELLRRVTIDARGDGEYYTLGNVYPIRYKIENQGHPKNARMLITLKVGIFHLRCGPPTCQTPASI